MSSLRTDLMMEAEDGTTFIIMIPESRKSLTEAEVWEVMDLLIEHKIFTPASGRLTVERTFSE